MAKLTATDNEDDPPLSIKRIRDLLKWELIGGWIGATLGNGLNSVEISATGLRASARVRRRYVINGYAISSPIRERVRISDVCQAMRDEFWQDGGDMILEEPDRLTIRYVVPRPNWPRKRAD